MYKTSTQQVIRRNVRTEDQTHTRVSTNALKELKRRAKESGVSIPVLIDDLLFGKDKD